MFCLLVFWIVWGVFDVLLLGVWLVASFIGLAFCGVLWFVGSLFVWCFAFCLLVMLALLIGV